MRRAGDAPGRFRTGPGTRRSHFAESTHNLRWPAGFVRRYLLDLGFLDGAAGFALARLYAAYDLEKATFLRRLARERAAEPSGPFGPPHPQGS